MSTRKAFLSLIPMGFVQLLLICTPFSVTAAETTKCAILFTDKRVERPFASHDETPQTEPTQPQDVLILIQKLSSIGNLVAANDVERYTSKLSPEMRLRFQRLQSSHTHPVDRLVQFLISEIDKIRDPKVLPIERDRSLAQQLREWGSTDSSSGYEQVQSLSKINLQRNKSRLKLRELEDLPSDIAEAVGLLDFEFRHNADAKTSYGYIMMSSRRLRELGMGQTLQNLSVYNREVVKSDDQLYFFVQPILRREGVRPHQSFFSPYGESSLYLHENFAERFGWISPYLMDHGDLIAYQLNMKKATGVDHPESMSLMLKNTYTVADFRTLYRLIVANYISGIIPPAPTLSADRLKKIIMGERHFITHDALIDLKSLLSHVGISGGLMELKVPVGIESTYIDVNFAKPDEISY